jgi:hypothetical protein
LSAADIGLGAGVVGIVDHDDAVRSGQHLHAPSFCARQGFEALAVSRSARKRRHGAHREGSEGVHDVVFSEDPAAAPRTVDVALDEG